MIKDSALNDENGGRRPVPDPTTLTTDAVDRGIAHVKELVNAHFTTVENDIRRLVSRVDAQPAAVMAELAHVTELTNEKFKGVESQFINRDKALTAALIAQKASVDDQNAANALAVSKSDATVTKQIDAIGVQIASTAKATDDKIDDLKSRVQAIEGHSKGTTDSWGWIVGAIGAAGALAAVIALIIAITNNEPSQVIVERPAVTTSVQ